MKIYCIYIIMTQEISAKLNYAMAYSKSLQMKYLDDGNTIVLYAWSNDKHLVREFMKIHKKEYFSVKKLKISKENFEKFSVDYSHVQLKHYEYVYNEKKEVLKIPSTFEEYSSVTMNFSEFKYEIVSPSVKVNFMIFKDRYIDALDLFLYVSEYLIRGELEFTESEERLIMQNFQTHHNRIINNEVGLYTILFESILNLK